MILFKNASGLLDHSQAVKDILNNDEQLKQEWKKAKIKQIQLKSDPNNEIQKYCIQFEISRLIEKTIKKVAEIDTTVKQEEQKIELQVNEESKMGPLSSRKINIIQDKLFEKILDIPNDYVRKQSSSNEFVTSNNVNNEDDKYIEDDILCLNIDNLQTKQTDEINNKKQFYETKDLTGLGSLMEPLSYKKATSKSSIK